MEKIRLHILHTGRVRVSPALPFGGENCSLIRASGMFTPKSEWLWLPVSVYLIEHPEHGRILVDAGWHREMSPDGVYDARAQIASLGSRLLYMTNQGEIPAGEAVDEQLAARGLKPSDLDLVLITHLDCDHVNGLRLVKDAKRILVAEAEVQGIRKPTLMNRIRYSSRWWDGVPLEEFSWNGTEGPAGRSFDVFGDGSVVMVNIPGHCDGLCAVKLKNKEGKYVLLFADGGYAEKSWKELITSGVAVNKAEQKKSLEWIRAESLNPLCIASFATHDSAVKPQTLEF